jgi:hypothetical protein
MSLGKIKTIILCNKKLFSPTANIECCIILIEKNNEGHLPETDIVILKDYSNDGIITEKHNGKVKSVEFETLYNNIINEKGIETKINFDTNWIKDLSNNKSLLCNEILEKIQYNNYKLELMKDLEFKLSNFKPLQQEVSFKSILIKDIIDISLIKKDLNKINNDNSNSKFVVKLKECQDYPTNEYKFPVVSSSKFNNGITKYSKFYTSENSFTINKNGSIGYCFYHDYKYIYTTDVISFTIKNNLNYFKNNKEIAMYFTEYFTNKQFDYNYKLNLSRFLNNSIELPYIKNIV